MEKENFKWLIYTVIAGCVICMVAVCFNVFTDMELPSRILAAILGVVITATITQVLLRGQTEKERTLRKDSKVFEEKLKIYQNFLNVLYQAVKDGELSKSGKLELQFQTSLVAMLCKPKNMEKVSMAIKGVIEGTCYDDSLTNDQKSKEPAKLLRCLFEVVDAFRQDLDETEPVFNQTDKSETIKNFNDAFDSAASSAEDEKPEIECVEAADEDVPIWKNAKSEWEKNGWKVNGPKEGEGFWLTITSENNPGVISMGLNNEHYYIQAAYEEDTAFSQGLKNERGGRRQKGMWWKYLPEPYNDVQMGKLVDVFKNDEKFQEYLIGRINYLLDIISKYNDTVQWKNALDKNISDNWTSYIWNWTCLACQCNDDKEGRLYIDIVPVQDGVEFRLGNRVENMKELKDTLRNHGLPDDKINKEDCWACVAKEAKTPGASTIAEKANSLMKQLSAR